MSGNNTSALIFQAIKRLLRPLVRLMIAQQITYNDCAKMLKEVFVSVADQDFKLEDDPKAVQTDSRLSLLTGIHRKEVKKLREHASTETEAPPTSSITAQLVAAWLSDPYCIDASGNPRTLEPYGELDPDTQQATFEYLVKSISKGNLRPATVLNECIRLNLVELNQAGKVELMVDAFIPTEEISEKLYFFEKNLTSHLAACCHNIQNPKALQNTPTPFFERSVSHPRVKMQDIESIKSLLNQDGMDLLKAVNRQAKSAQNKINADDIDTHQFTLGIYFYHTPPPEDHTHD